MFSLETKFLHCMAQAEFLELALREGLMLRNHTVKFAPTDDPVSYQRLMADILPLLEGQLAKSGTSLAEFDRDTRELIFRGIGSVKGQIPMLCIAEVQKGSEINNLKAFGSYGLVISKSWLMSHGADRVVYIGDASTGSRLVYKALASLRIQGITVADGKVLFDNKRLRSVFDMLPFVQERCHAGEFEWRIAGNHGFMGGGSDAGKKIAISLDDIEFVFAPKDEVDAFTQLVAELQAGQKLAKAPQVMAFPEKIPF